MFTLVTRGLRHRWSLESCLCDSSPATTQLRNSDAAAIGIVANIAAESLNVTIGRRLRERKSVHHLAVLSESAALNLMDLDYAKRCGFFLEPLRCPIPLRGIDATPLAKNKPQYWAQLTMCMAPAHQEVIRFLSFMHDIFREYLDKFLIVYLDDILIFSDDWESHVKQVRMVFQVEVDASEIGAGAVLSQRGSGCSVFKPCAFFSRKFSAAERNYDVGNRELLAMKWAFEEWRHWLEGAKHRVVVLTDHKNLTYLESAKRLNPRQARWSLFFARFDFVISYLPGSKNVKADALSRSFVPDSPGLSEPASILKEGVIVSAISPDLRRVLQKFQANKPDRCPAEKLFVPDRWTSKVISELHCSVLAGHPGIFGQVESSDCPGVDYVVDRLQQIWTQGRHTRILTDNRAVVAYVNHQGGTRSKGLMNADDPSCDPEDQRGSGEDYPHSSILAKETMVLPSKTDVGNRSMDFARNSGPTNPGPSNPLSGASYGAINHNGAVYGGSILWGPSTMQHLMGGPSTIMEQCTGAYTMEHLMGAINLYGAKLKKNGRNANQYLLDSPNQTQSATKQSRTPKNRRKSSAPRTPRCQFMEEARPNSRVTPKSSKRASPYTRRASSSQWKSFSNIVGNEGLNLRRSVRAASLNSPYASPVTGNRRRQFEKDLESVSAGIRQLKRLSRVFDDAILKEESLTAGAPNNLKNGALQNEAVKLPALTVSAPAVKQSTAVTSPLCSALRPALTVSAGKLTAGDVTDIGIFLHTIVYGNLNCPYSLCSVGDEYLLQTLLERRYEWRLQHHGGGKTALTVALSPARHTDSVRVRKEAILNYHSVMTKNLRCTRHSRLSWRSTRKLQRTLEGWTEVALTSIGNIGAR
ncbi:unnamed protein product [Ranitomeya imitator]|uniref:Reverse transcriptase RNase H-like domain-containing protein n=1 Tax=Ranitomeya imitator TaxID=111125 RepID=A0ABN9M8T3_9NEOB|nr:unnamed protein product [Ranitomeya imitator]